MEYPYIGQRYSAIILFYATGKGLLIDDALGFDEGSKLGDEVRVYDGTNITREYLEGKCVKIESPEHSEFVQKLAFNAGYLWLGSISDIKDYDAACFYFKDKYLSWDDEEHFNSINLEQTTIPLPPKAEPERYKFKEGEIPSAPKHFDCVCNKCGGKCCAGNCEPKEWPVVGDEVTTRYGLGKVASTKDKDGYYPVMVNDQYLLLTMDAIKKPKTEAEILRDEIETAIIKALKDENFTGDLDLGDIASIIHSALDCNLSITKKPQ